MAVWLRDTQQLATLRALGEYRGKQRLYIAQLPEVLNDLRQVAVVESTESSNRLERVVVAAARLKSLVLSPTADVAPKTTQPDGENRVYSNWPAFDTRAPM